MSFRYFLRLSYKGTSYHGWQVQPDAITVQEVLNQKLSMLLREEIYAVGAGRTDTGVHAPCFFAHFDSEKDNLDTTDIKLVHKLNCVLPFDIAVQAIYKVKNDAHARFSAISRTYLYRISFEKNPFTTEVTYAYTRMPDVPLMNEAASLLMQYSDFSSFSKQHSGAKTNLCKISAAQWANNQGELQFTITADRFLRNMVRAIVGTLLEVGFHKITIETFKNIIAGKNRSLAGSSAEAKGLHLVGIEYPADIFK